MGWLIGLIVARTGWSASAARFAATAGLVLIVLGLLAGVVAWIRHDAVADHQAKVEKRAAPASDAAATERANDVIANAKKEQEAHNAVHSVPDAAPAGPSHALACKRLHDLGRDPSACR